MRSLELFSGAGGLAKGLELAGFEHSGFVEFNKHACSSLRENFSSDLVCEGDVRGVDFREFGPVDLVAGGPPCQPFSNGGKHLANADSRDMFPEAIRAIRTLTPKAFVFENVKGLLRKSFSAYFEYILLRLTFPNCVIASNESWLKHCERLRALNPESYSGLKYEVEFKLLNSADYGVPQTRQRVFIVGSRSDLSASWSWPEPTHSKLSLKLSQSLTNEYWDRHGISVPASYKQSGICAKQLQSDFFGNDLKPWVTVRDALAGVPHPANNTTIVDHTYRKGAKTYPGHTGSYIDEPAKTLKAGVHGVPGGENMIRYEDGTVRYFSVYEGKLLQTFPKDFKILGAWGEGMRQIGNAVPVALAETLGASIAKMLSKEEAASVSKAA